MSALSRFLDRHGLDENFRAKAAFGASFAVVAAATVLAPINARAGESSFLADRDSSIGGAGMSQRLQMVAERINDRIGDMAVINRELHRMPDLAHPSNGDIAARIVIEINNRLYQDTPYPQFAEYDMSPLGVPGSLAEGAAMEYAVGAINFQKETLLRATESLKDIVNAYQSGTRNDVDTAIAKMDTVIENYRISEPRVLDNINSSLREMRANDGWERGYNASY